jgi:hypothetical protein
VTPGDATDVSAAAASLGDGDANAHALGAAVVAAANAEIAGARAGHELLFGDALVGDVFGKLAAVLYSAEWHMHAGSARAAHASHGARGRRCTAAADRVATDARPPYKLVLARGSGRRRASGDRGAVLGVARVGAAPALARALLHAWGGEHSAANHVFLRNALAALDALCRMCHGCSTAFAAALAAAADGAAAAGTTITDGGTSRRGARRC